jgi:type VI secretion system protein ImpK
LAHASTPSGAAFHGGLALALQEAFTATVRLRANRQVASDAESFRAHMKSLLAAAHEDARARGYAEEEIRFAVYALIAFLDESVLHSSQPMFSGWRRQPLQEEVFGDHMAGETFFQHLRTLMGRQESAELADVLEVYDLCLLLGFHGRHGAETAELRSLRTGIREKIERIRGGDPLAPAAHLPADEDVPERRDPWIRRLGIAAGVALLLCVTLFGLYSWLLAGEVEALRDAAGTPATMAEAPR